MEKPDRKLLWLALVLSSFFILMLIPFQQGPAQDLGIISYKNATLASATFEEAHTEGNLPWDEYDVPDTWTVKVRVGGRTITSNNRAVYNSIVGQNSIDLVVKVSKQKVFYKRALFEKYEDYEYSLVE